MKSDPFVEALACLINGGRIIRKTWKIPASLGENKLVIDIELENSSIKQFILTETQCDQIEQLYDTIQRS